jgi:hypothetical protein
MPQFAELLGAAGRHDHCVRTVVGTGQCGHVTGESCDQQNSHAL